MKTLHFFSLFGLAVLLGLQGCANQQTHAPFSSSSSLHPTQQEQTEKAARTVEHPRAASEKKHEAASDNTARTGRGLAPAKVVAGMMLARLAQLEGEPEAAYRTLLKLVRRYPHPKLARMLYEAAQSWEEPGAMKTAALLWTHIDPKALKPRRALWLLEAESGDIQAALRAFDDWARLTPASLDEDLVRAGRLMLETLDVSRAGEMLQALRQRYPDRWGSWVAWADYLMQGRNQPDMALDALNRALSMQGKPAVINPRRADAYVRAGRVAEGLRQLQAYVRHHPRDWGTQKAYASLEFSHGDDRDAQARLERVLKALRAKSDPAADSIQLSLGLIRMEQGALETARKLLEPLTDNPKVSQQAAYYLGRIAELQGDSKRAAGYYLQIQDPRFVMDAQLRLVRMLGQRQPQRALSILDHLATAAETPAEQMAVQMTRAELLRRLNRPDEAREALYQAERLAGDNRTLLTRLVLQYDDMGWQDEAIRFLQQQVAQHPDDAGLLNQLGYLYLKQNRSLEEAARLIEKAARLAPDSPEVWDSLGLLRYRQGRLKEARTWWEKAWHAQRARSTLVRPDISSDWEPLAHLLQVNADLQDWRAFEQLRQRYADVIQKVPALRALVSRLQLHKKSDGILDF